MAYEGYECLKIWIDRGAAFADIDHPPINLFDAALRADLTRFADEVEADPSVKVVVFGSANPDFFIAHADVTSILQNAVARRQMESAPPDDVFRATQQRRSQWRLMPKVSIAKIEGRARGGGSEFALRLDMRFGAIGRAIIGQPEVALGILPGGGGTQYLPRLIGRGRAMEICLGCADYPAELAEYYGYFNRVFPPEELGPFVEELAYRIASFPAEAIALAKASINAADTTIADGLFQESKLFNDTLATAPAEKRMAKFMEIGGQTREVELELPETYRKLAEE